MPRDPDGLTVLTSPETLNSCNGPVVGRRRHLPSFIPDTNAIEALNRQLRKAIKTKGSFPTEDAARKLIYLAHQRGAGLDPTRNWTVALLAFKIHFGDRVPGCKLTSPLTLSTPTLEFNHHPPTQISGVRPALEVVVEYLIQHKLVVACRCESGPGSCQEAR